MFRLRQRSLDLARIDLGISDGDAQGVSASAPQQRLEVHFRGQVQGVGFRYTTRRIAQRYRVVGYVRNLPDGRVHLVAEGDAAETESFLADVAQAMNGYIADSDVERGSGSGDFHDFCIRH